MICCPMPSQCDIITLQSIHVTHQDVTMTNSAGNLTIALSISISNAFVFCCDQNVKIGTGQQNISQYFPNLNYSSVRTKASSTPAMLAVKLLLVQCTNCKQ